VPDAEQFSGSLRLTRLEVVRVQWSSNYWRCWVCENAVFNEENLGACFSVELSVRCSPEVLLEMCRRRRLRGGLCVVRRRNSDGRSNLDRRVRAPNAIVRMNDCSPPSQSGTKDTGSRLQGNCLPWAYKSRMFN
jgi:hypothetical protein